MDYSGHDIHLYLNSVVKARTRVVFPDGTEEVATGKMHLKDPSHDYHYETSPDNLLKIFFYVSIFMIVLIFVVIGVIALINN